MKTANVFFPSMTVVRTNGVRLGADQITATLRDGDLHPMLTFVCSGRSVSVPAEEVERIEYFVQDGTITDICTRCEQHIVGPKRVIPEAP